MGGRSVKDTTQLRLSMLPMSTYMSGSPMMCVSGSGRKTRDYFDKLAPEKNDYSNSLRYFTYFLLKAIM